MTEIKKLKNEFSKFNKKSDYLTSDKEKGKKIYTIYSEELKQSLREIIHSKASEEWQIKHVLGENFIEYGIEQDGEFGLYRKNLIANSPDEFLITLEGWSSPEKEEFTSAARACEESRQKIEIERKQIEMIRKKNNQENKGLESNILGENCISITFQKNEKGERLITKEESYNDPNKEQEIREGWGYNFTKQMLSEWAGKQKDKDSQKIIQKVLEDNSDNKETKQEKTDEKNSSNSGKQDQQTEKVNNQQNPSQKIDNKDNNSKKVFYGIGSVSLVVLVISMLVVWVKKKR
jgi:hypothetical protein